MKKRLPPRPTKFPVAKQRRMDELLEKNREGTITAKERARLSELVAEAERLMVENTRRLQAFARSEKAPAGAVPVTVWIMPQQAER